MRVYSSDMLKFSLPEIYWTMFRISGCFKGRVSKPLAWPKLHMPLCNSLIKSQYLSQGISDLFSLTIISPDNELVS